MSAGCVQAWIASKDMLPNVGVVVLGWVGPASKDDSGFRLCVRVEWDETNDYDGRKMHWVQWHDERLDQPINDDDFDDAVDVPWWMPLPPQPVVSPD